KSLLCCTRMLLTPRFFLFYILKKIKFQKYMSVFKYFKNIPRSPSHRATGPMCNFFFKFATKSLEKKKRTCRPPFFSRTFIFAGTYFELFERVFVIIVGKISAANSYRT